MCSRPGVPAPGPLPPPCSGGRAPRCTQAHSVPKTRSPPVGGASPARPGRLSLNPPREIKCSGRWAARASLCSHAGARGRDAGTRGHGGWCRPPGRWPAPALAPLGACGGRHGLLPDSPRQPHPSRGGGGVGHRRPADKPLSRAPQQHRTRHAGWRSTEELKGTAGGRPVSKKKRASRERGEHLSLATPTPESPVLEAKWGAGGEVRRRAGWGRQEKKRHGAGMELQQSQECTKTTCQQLTCIRKLHASGAGSGARGAGRELQGRGAGARRATAAATSWCRAAPGPSHASSFLLLVDHFLSGPGSPEDSRVGIGDLVEGRGDCPRFKLEPGSLCSFLFCGFSEVHVGASQWGAVSEATSHRGACSSVPGAAAPPAS